MKGLVAAAGLVLCACPAVRQPPSDGVVISGSVTWGGFDRRAEPLGDVLVTVSSGAATGSATSAASGEFRVELPAQDVAPVVFTAWRPGFVPLVRRLRAGTRTELQRSFALTPLTPMDCVDTGCTAGFGAVRWVDAPSGANAAVALLAGDEVPALASTDGLLTAAAVELDGGTLPGALWLRVPVSAWPDVVDTQPGTGAIEVSVATLGPLDRAWMNRGAGLLRTEAGSVISEAQLTRVRSGIFAPGVVVEVPPLAQGVVGVFGAPARQGCVEGTVVIDDRPAAGVTVVPASGVPGASTETGAVCVEAPLGSEPQPARVQYAGVVFTGVTIPAATEPGRCGQTCRALGRLSVRGEAVATVAPCALTVRVVDEANQPLPGAVVIGMDDGLTQAAFSSICGRMGTRCTLTGATDGDGGVRLVVPVLAAVSLGARATVASGLREGSARAPACPKEPLVLQANRGADVVEATAQLSGASVSWTPNVPAYRMRLERDGGVAWAVRSFIGVAGPLTVGATPPGAEVEVAGTGPLQPGDVVVLSFDGVRPSGIAQVGTASVRVE